MTYREGEHIYADAPYENALCACHIHTKEENPYHRDGNRPEGGATRQPKGYIFRKMVEDVFARHWVSATAIREHADVWATLGPVGPGSDRNSYLN